MRKILILFALLVFTVGCTYGTAADFCKTHTKILEFTTSEGGGYYYVVFKNANGPSCTHKYFHRCVIKGPKYTSFGYYNDGSGSFTNMQTFVTSTGDISTSKSEKRLEDLKEKKEQYSTNKNKTTDKETKTEYDPNDIWDDDTWGK